MSQSQSARARWEVKLDGLRLDIGNPALNWSNTLRETAKAVASVAMERAIEFGESHVATIEVWGDDGTLLVAVSANVHASWPEVRPSGLPGAGAVPT